MARRNLFEFATSELSQDAFLCWLVANASQDEHPELRTIGRALIGWLSNNGQHGSIPLDHIRLLDGPHRQRHRCDIIFEAEIAGRRTKVLIEDKTGTSHHSDQLARYKRDLGFGDADVLVYFKTGYHYPLDLQAEEHGYTVIGMEKWVEFLKTYPIVNDIYEDYRSHSENLLGERAANLAALDGPGGHGKLGVDYVQFEFMKRLAAGCAETMPEAMGKGSLDRGSNLGGTPWTQYQFAKFPVVQPGDIGEAIFYRVDARNDPSRSRRYYLSPRQYAVVKGNPDARAEKVRRLHDRVAAFSRAIEESGSTLKFSARRTDYQGANESEVGILFFDDEANTIARVLDQFPLVHRAFVKSLRSSR